KKAQRIDGNTAGAIPRCNRESVGVARLKIREAIKDEPAGIAVEAVAVEAPELATEFEVVISVQPAEGVGENAGEVASSLRKSRRSTEVKTNAEPVHLNLRQPNRGRNSIADVEIDGIEFYIWREGNKNTVEAQARLIDPLRREDVRLVQRENLAARLA